MKSITIVGGGLAGLTLGIGLRQHNVPVTVWEAGDYPRHRVCGEFLCGRGQEILHRLGLREPMLAAGVRTATTAAFFSPSRGTVPVELPQPAWCLSRYLLDDLLARKFSQQGGNLRVRERWRGEGPEDGLVRASGRRMIPHVNGWRWFGLKAHAQGVQLCADLEMHLGPNGYVGLCRLAGGKVNVCGLFRSRVAVADLLERWQDWLRGPAGSPLHQRLDGAQFEAGSFCCVAGLSMQAHLPSNPAACSVGDALTLIPPVTGNGMSLALESAELAVQTIFDYSRGVMRWEEACCTIGTRFATTFARRLRQAGRLQRALFAPVTREALVFLMPRCHHLWRGLFLATR